jgi:hypothetical protein
MADRRGNGEAKPPRGWAEGLNGGEESWPGVERRDGIRRGVGRCSASGMHLRLARQEQTLQSGCIYHLDDICRTAGYVTRLAGGVGGGRP